MASSNTDMLIEMAGTLMKYVNRNDVLSTMEEMVVHINANDSEFVFKKAESLLRDLKTRPSHPILEINICALGSLILLWRAQEKTISSSFKYVESKTQNESFDIRLFYSKLQKGTE